MSKIKPKFRGLIKDGKLRMDQFMKNKFLVYVKQLEGQKVYVVIDKQDESRTLKQNSYLWAGVYQTISEATGYTQEEVHEIMKAKCLPRRFVEFNGEEIEIRKSTTTLTKPEFWEYVNRIASEVSPMGIYIPTPEGFSADMYS